MAASGAGAGPDFTAPVNASYTDPWHGQRYPATMSGLSAAAAASLLPLPGLSDGAVPGTRVSCGYPGQEVDLAHAVRAAGGSPRRPQMRSRTLPVSSTISMRAIDPTGAATLPRTCAVPV